VHCRVIPVDERVLVVPTEDVTSLLGGREGLVSIPFHNVARVIEKRGRFIIRSVAERDETLRQVIPYMIATDGTGRVLLMRRTEKQGERRLHGKYSLGIGGHVNTDDATNPLEAFLRGKGREFYEEVDADILEENYLGIINDPSTEVGRVHLGVAYLLQLKFRRVVEEDQMESWWIDVNDLARYRDALEGWSKVVIPAVKQLLGHSTNGHSSQ